tara:strand:- start:1057 stop:1971 length:915 start_codon:yes stop_codon:yes gene_type:complete
MGTTFNDEILEQGVNMKYVSFLNNDKNCFGILLDDNIIDLTSHYESFREGMDWIPSLKSALEDDRINELNNLDLTSMPNVKLTDVKLMPVIPDPGKIFCVGLNYENHRAETKRPESSYPTIFTRFAGSQTAHNDKIICPKVSDKLDYEGEMAIIIGKSGRYIEEKNAMEHIAGYACYNDATIRDWQKHTSQFTPGKNFHRTGAFGPYMLSADEVSDYKELNIQTRLNGEIMQDASLSDLIFPLEKLVNYCSSFIELQPGDVIVTGTPGGVGDRREPPVYMKNGDVVEIEISKLGILTNVVEKEI